MDTKEQISTEVSWQTFFTQSVIKLELKVILSFSQGTSPKEQNSELMLAIRITTWY